MKIALVHDYLSEYGGAERVVEALHEIWPEAPLYTAFVDWKRLGKHSDRFKNWDIRPSWVQHFWIIKKLISPLRFLAPCIWQSFDLSGYDAVITSSGWFIPRGVIVKKPTVHVCYIHHPPRNLYGYATGSNLQKYWPVRLYTIFVNFFLRNYDFQTAQKVDYFIANSKETRRRVKKFYRRESVVIYPPIPTNTKIQISNSKQIPKSKFQNKKYYLSVGRLSWAKRVDLIIEACNKLHAPLKIVGVGKEEKELKKIAGPTIEFLGSVSDAELSDLYVNAKALIFASLDEDFGMVPVEAMAYGTPVIGLCQGGVKETVIEGKTGILFHEPTVDALTNAIKRFELMSKSKEWTRECMNQAEKFAVKEFKSKLSTFMKEKLPS